MKLSVLSIPGLPNALMGLDSKVYHDYDSILEVIKAVFEPESIHFEDYVWPKEIGKKEVDWAKRVPGLAVPLYYFYYNLDAEYRNEVVEKAKDYIRRGFKEGDLLVLILHSHGNRVAFDALLDLGRAGELASKRVLVLSFAPAFKNVVRGIVPPGLTQSELEKIQDSVELLLSFRMRSDLLSGDPELENTYFFDPKLYEFGWVGHATIRNRKDVMDCLEAELKAYLEEAWT
jgi:hypothetical protein